MLIFFENKAFKYSEYSSSSSQKLCQDFSQDIQASQDEISKPALLCEFHEIFYFRPIPFPQCTIILVNYV